MTSSVRSALVWCVVCVAAGAFTGVAEARTFTVGSTGDSGRGTLRWAIEAANQSAGDDVIAFAFPPGPVTLVPLSPLPYVTDTVLIEGRQKGVHQVVIDGSLAGPGAIGLVLYGPRSVVRGLTVHSFDEAGISLLGEDSVMEDCRLGTDVTGMVELGNGVGVAAYRDRQVLVGNLVSGNRIGGIFADGTGSRIERNTIGPSSSGGDFPFGVGSSQPRSLEVYWSAGLVVRDNLISGSGTGIRLERSFAAQVVGNTIGSTPDGGARLGRLLSGIEVDSQSNWVAIGGSAPGEANRIAFIGDAALGTGDAAISVTRSLSNPIRGNRIHDLEGAVRAIAIHDPMYQQWVAAPAVIQAASDGVNLEVRAEFTATPDELYLLDLYTSPVSSPTTSCEAREHLGYAKARTDALGRASVAFVLQTDTPVGHFVSATVTSVAEGDTSELSGCREVR
jgi:hypothetical protein